MNEHIKILLGSEDIIIRDNEDSFINIELSRTSSEIMPNSVENDFNLRDQYTKERNESLKFCIYGTVESKYVDCTGITMGVKTSDDDILITPKKAKGATSSVTHLISTIPLSKNGSLSRNIYGKEKSSYFFLFEIDRELFERKLNNKRLSRNVPKTDNIIITTDDSVKKIFDVIEIPFIFYDENGEFIPYGTKTTDVDTEGSLTETDNDFPFFYDRHWIKSNIFPSKLASVAFVPTGSSVIVPENIIDGTFLGEVKLDFPSKFGKESVTVILDKDDTIRNPNLDFSFLPQILKWNIGDISKTFNIDIVNDLYVESAERVSFKLIDIQNAQIDKEESGKFTIEIINDDIPSQARFAKDAITVSESAETLDIEIVFDKPIEVSEQYIDVVVESGAGTTTALAGVDFSLGVQGRPGVNSKTIFVKEGDTGTTFSLDILNDFRYESVKTMTVRLDNPSQNIVVSGRGNGLLITIIDSGPKIKTFAKIEFQDIFKQNRETSINRVELKVDNSGNDNLSKVSSPTGSIVLYNHADFDMIVEGVTIPANGNAEIKGILSGMNLILPGNDGYSTENKSYDKAKYTIELNIETLGKTSGTKSIKETIEIDLVTSKDSPVYYITSILSDVNVKSRFNNNGNVLCDTTLFHSQKVNINGIAFLASGRSKLVSILVGNATVIPDCTQDIPIKLLI